MKTETLLFKAYAAILITVVIAAVILAAFHIING